MPEGGIVNLGGEGEHGGGDVGAQRGHLCEGGDEGVGRGVQGK